MRLRLPRALILRQSVQDLKPGPLLSARTKISSIASTGPSPIASPVIAPRDASQQADSNVVRSCLIANSIFRGIIQ